MGSVTIPFYVWLFMCFCTGWAIMDMIQMVF